ncbi:MAG TPA: prenyltransferase/squalene oxidase repeat-containing protein [Pirellulales bacterium]|nr:prenyltransferase/squalene oxidase repeat-containing protein [Pirellulales bacterium]
MQRNHTRGNRAGASRLAHAAAIALCLLLAASAAARADQPPAEEAVPDAREMLRVEAAVDRALDHLARRQNEEGWWPQNVNAAGPNNGINAFGLLAFLGRGHTPGRGPHQLTVGRAINYILSTQNEQGLYASPGPSQGPMYEHALATLSLIEAYGAVGSLEMRGSVQKAIDLIVASQNDQGGWRYQPHKSDADLSVTVMQVVALRAAINARLNVPQATTDKAVQYVKSCASPAGGFSYQPGGGPNCAQTAAGSLCMQLLGQFDDPSVPKGLQFLQSKNYDAHIDPYFYYTSYYSMQAHFQAGETQWAVWHPRVRKFLLDTQNEDGSWPGHGEDRLNGPAMTYSTALGAMCLEVYMHYLPAYQR